MPFNFQILGYVNPKEILELFLTYRDWQEGKAQEISRKQVCLFSYKLYFCCCSLVIIRDLVVLISSFVDYPEIIPYKIYKLLIFVFFVFGSRFGLDLITEGRLVESSI